MADKSIDESKPVERVMEPPLECALPELHDSQLSFRKDAEAVKSFTGEP